MIMVAVISLVLLTIAAEVFYASRMKLQVYRFQETVSHFTNGVGQQVFNLFWFSGLALVYGWVHHRTALFDFDTASPWSWLTTLLLVELCWYTAHRLSHRVNFFIASHAVHHQALDFNHGSALRQSWTSRPVIFLFFVPLALLGIPAEMVLGAQLFSSLIQFFTHNGVITRRLGWLEYVFVTPRTHRVHHGVNAPYLDRNFGGMFIFWDRLFGTYADLDERVPVQIGSRDQFNHHDPIEANLNYYRRILFVARARRGLWNKLSIWLESPESLEAELKAYRYREKAKNTGQVSSKGAIYALIALTTISLLALMKNAQTLDWLPRICLSLFILSSIWLIGRLLTARPQPQPVMRLKRA